MVHCTYQGVPGRNFQIMMYFSLILANSTDVDEIPHYAVFHLGFTAIWDFQYIRDNGYVRGASILSVL